MDIETGPSHVHCSTQPPESLGEGILNDYKYGTFSWLGQQVNKPSKLQFRVDDRSMTDSKIQNDVRFLRYGK